jgi:hypothetical protein
MGEVGAQLAELRLLRLDDLAGDTPERASASRVAHNSLLLQ